MVHRQYFIFSPTSCATNIPRCTLTLTHHTLKRQILLLYVQRCVVCLKHQFDPFRWKCPNDCTPQRWRKQWKHRTTAHRTCSCTQWKPASHIWLESQHYYNALFNTFFFTWELNATGKKKRCLVLSKNGAAPSWHRIHCPLHFHKVSFSRLVLVPFDPKYVPLNWKHNALHAKLWQHPTSILTDKFCIWKSLGFFFFISLAHFNAKNMSVCLGKV